MGQCNQIANLDRIFLKMNFSLLTLPTPVIIRTFPDDVIPLRHATPMPYLVAPHGFGARAFAPVFGTRSFSWAGTIRWGPCSVGTNNRSQMASPP